MIYDEAKIDHIRYLLSALKTARTARDELLAASKAKKGCVEFVLSKYNREPKPNEYMSSWSVNGDDGRQKIYTTNTENIAHLLMPIFQGRIRDIETELVSLNVELPPEVEVAKK